MDMVSAPSGRTCRRLRGTFPRRFAFPEIPGSGALNGPFRPEPCELTEKGCV